jgi:putative FmdB family regulatory protein
MRATGQATIKPSDLTDPAVSLQTPLMPIYEYHCLGCGAEFELLVRSDTEILCPSCESAKVTRQLSAPARAGGQGGAESPDFSRLGPPGGGGCHGGSCGCH